MYHLIVQQNSGSNTFVGSLGVHWNEQRHILQTGTYHCNLSTQESFAVTTVVIWWSQEPSLFYSATPLAKAWVTWGDIMKTPSLKIQETLIRYYGHDLICFLMPGLNKRKENRENHLAFDIRQNTSWDDRQLGDIWQVLPLIQWFRIDCEKIAAFVVYTIIRSTKMFAKECKFMGVRFSFYTEDKLKLLKHLKVHLFSQRSANTLLFLLLLQRKVRALFK